MEIERRVFERGDNKEFRIYAGEFKVQVTKMLARQKCTVEEFMSSDYSLKGFYRIKGYFKTEKGQLYHFKWKSGDIDLTYRTAKDMNDEFGGYAQRAVIAKDMELRIRNT